MPLSYMSLVYVVKSLSIDNQLGKKALLKSHPACSRGVKKLAGYSLMKIAAGSLRVY